MLQNSSIPSYQTCFDFSACSDVLVEQLFACCVPNICTDSNEKQTVLIMVFENIASNSDAMPSFIFLHGIRQSTETYMKYLEELVLPQIERVAVRRFHINQKNSVPCHTSRRAERKSL